MPTFTVDTHVFRELGELLVGRDSTALVELIKNSYDADATSVVVYGEKLNDAARGLIVVSDDGMGMDLAAFQEGFLRIASRTKDSGARRSSKFKRRYTGAKGIGRLAAHKLASLLEVESISTARGASGGVKASIDWDRVEAEETLEEVGATNAISVSDLEVERGAKSGTRISLRKLRRRWSHAEHARFLEEVQSFQILDSLRAKLPVAVLRKKLLFDIPRYRDEGVDADFMVSLEGELAPPDDYFTALADAANWVLEVDALSDPGSVRYGIAPTNRTVRALGEFDVRRFRLAHPGGDKGPRFQARILIRTGNEKGVDRKAWSVKSSGVRVFMEGFRVLPYGEPSNDWLSLDRDYSARSSDFITAEIAGKLSPTLEDLAGGDRPGLLTLPNRSYVGAVFLTQNNAASLRALVNREGFIPDQAYLHLVDILRIGVDLATRTRSAASATLRQARREERQSTKNAVVSEPLKVPQSFVSVLADAERHMIAAKRFVTAGRTDAANRQMTAGLTQLKFASEASADYADQYAMMRVLASTGTHLSSFVHELNGLLGMAETIEAALNRFIESSDGLSRTMRSELREISKATGDLRRQVERNASYLIDVVSVDAKRRRTRQVLNSRAQSAIKLVQTAAERRGITITNDLPDNLKSPPMFPAELTTVFANLLTNAIKAAGKKGKIRVHGRGTEESTVVRVENTGKAVNVRNSERWFKPFESSSAEIEPVLGQGMGLGLTITRAMLEEYGATIKFVKPGRGYSTAVEITLNA